jgi:hypothetical protein
VFYDEFACTVFGKKGNSNIRLKDVTKSLSNKERKFFKPVQGR